MEWEKKLGKKTQVKFIYHVLKPRSIIDIWTTQPCIAEELSRQGCTVYAKGVWKV